VDDEVRVRVAGLEPGARVVVSAATEDDAKREWTSQAEFQANESGCVDVAEQESRGGSYRGISPAGLFWSMRLNERDAGNKARFAKTGTSSHSVRIEIKVAGLVMASDSLERRFIAPGTEVRDLTIPGDAGQSCIVGRLFIPCGELAKRPLTVVIVLNGSGGGFDLDKAAVLSRHGFATLALAYFGVAPLPQWLHRIPIEYFEAALTWLAAQRDVDSQRIGVLGISRGSELALLSATAFPSIRAVVAYAPSSTVWSSGGSDKSTGEIIPCWTWKGEPVPFAPLPLRSFMLRSAIPVVAFRRPVMFRNLFRAAARDREAVERAAIPVERIRGPVLLISGGDDHVWPAAEMSEAIVARIGRHGSAHPVEHLHFPRAGHMLRYPHLPTTARESRNPYLRNARFSFGGTPEADAEAQQKSWHRAIAFLQANL
jgi:dienelactone hydrolase